MIIISDQHFQLISCNHSEMSYNLHTNKSFMFLFLRFKKPLILKKISNFVFGNSGNFAIIFMTINKSHKTFILTSVTERIHFRN